MTLADLSRMLPARSLRARRTRLLLALLLVALAALPWLALLLEPRFPGTRGRILAAIESGIALGLGTWIAALVARDAQRLHARLQRLERRSRTDPLTGLRNRRGLESDLHLVLRRSRRLGLPIAVLHLDVDDFQHVNARHGPPAGDETLRCMAGVLRSSSRLGVDSAYRVGGDEFVLVVGADRDGADLVGRRISRAFHERSPHGSRVRMGVVVWDREVTASELVAETEGRMRR